MLLGSRDPAQPLLTLRDGQARVELSGSTTANWIAKTANLLVDGHDSPDRVGLLLPLGWQAVCFLLGAAATGATVVIATDPSELAGCGVAFTTVETAAAALAVGVEDVLVVSDHPMGAPLASVPVGALDAGREVPGYGDRFGGAAVQHPRFEVAGALVDATPGLALTADDRLLTCLPLAAGVGIMLAALGAGAALVLAPAPDDLDRLAVAAAEQVTVTAGLTVCGLRRVDLPAPS